MKLKPKVNPFSKKKKPERGFLHQPVPFGLLFALIFFGLNALVFAAPPQRIVSTNLCIDFLLVHHLNQKHLDAQRILALSPLYARFKPPFADNLPTHSGSLEAIIFLQPDLILMGEFDSFYKKQALQNLGFNVQTLPLPFNFQDLNQLETQFLSALHLPQQWATPLPATSPPFPNAPRLLMLGEHFIATGRNTFENHLIEQAGFQNAVPFEGFQPFSLEHILSSPPDFILYTTSFAHHSLATDRLKHPALHAIQKLAIFDWHFQCAGPWSFNLLNFLKKINR